MRDIDFIKEILEMPESQEERFQNLLTSNIWKSNVRGIREILEMPELNNPNYSHLLIPSIFSISLKNIKLSIELFEEYGIGEFITNRCLRRNVELQRKLLEYLVENNIDLIFSKSDGSYSLNPILNASSLDLKKKYGIDIKGVGNKGVKRHG